MTNSHQANNTPGIRFEESDLIGLGPRPINPNVVVMHSRMKLDEAAGALYDSIVTLPGFAALEGKLPREVFTRMFSAATVLRTLLIAKRRSLVVMNTEGHMVAVVPPKYRLNVDYRHMRLPGILHTIMAQFGPVVSEDVGVTFWPLFPANEIPSEEEVAWLNKWLPHYQQFLAAITVLTPLSDSAPSLDSQGGWGAVLLPVSLREQVQSTADEMSFSATQAAVDLGKSAGSPAPAVPTGAPFTPGLAVEADPGNYSDSLFALVPPAGSGYVNYNLSFNVLGPSKEAKPIDALIAGLLGSATRPRGVMFCFEYGTVQPAQAMMSLLARSVRYVPIVPLT